VPPFILVGKHPVQYSGINSLGLSRRGFSDEEKADIKKAYRYLFRSDLNQSDALSKVRNELSNSKHINDIIHFYESSKRGII
jgi:UDP-N-acetylglucosamine acyltransferase